MTDDERPRRRTRRRGSAPAGAPRTTAPEAQSAPRPEQALPPKARKPRVRTPDRGMHDLAGTGASQLGTSRALRARDVNRPTEDDLAAAERELVVVRRNWRPQ